MCRESDGQYWLLHALLLYKLLPTVEPSVEWKSNQARTVGTTAYRRYRVRAPHAFPLLIHFLTPCAISKAASSATRTSKLRYVAKTVSIHIGESFVSLLFADLLRHCTGNVSTINPKTFEESQVADLRRDCAVEGVSRDAEENKILHASDTRTEAASEVAATNVKPSQSAILPEIKRPLASQSRVAT